MDILKLPYQAQKQFFHEGSPPPEMQRRWSANPCNPECPFNRWPGDPEAIKPLLAAANLALDRHNHQCDSHFSLHGPVSHCEELASIFAEVLELPLVIIRGLHVEETKDLLLRIAQVCEETIIETKQGAVNLELVPGLDEEDLSAGENVLTVPPLVAYIDELRDLPDAVLRTLLKTMHTEGHRLAAGPWLVDISRVCWLLASQDIDLLERLGFKLVRTAITQ